MFLFALNGLVSTVGDASLSPILRNENHFPANGPTRLAHQDIIRQPSQSPLRPNGSRMESPNGKVFLNLVKPVLFLK